MDGHCYKYDVSLPMSKYYDVVDYMRASLSGRASRICGYGHVGDGTVIARIEILINLTNT